jgi:hypothetical protein
VCIAVVAAFALTGCRLDILCDHAKRSRSPGASAVNAPRDFFDAYVKPAIADCESDPGAVHRAVSALCHIDALAEEVWHAKPQIATSSSAYRTALKGKLVELAYAWDVHDIHKHGTLTRRTPVLPNGRRPEVVQVERAFDPEVFDPNVFDVGGPMVILTLQDGKQIAAIDVMRTCAQWWSQELAALGWA